MIEVGKQYKVNRPTAKGSYTIRSINVEKQEVVAVASKDFGFQGAKIRVFRIEDLIVPTEKAKREKKDPVEKKMIVADLVSKVDGPWAEGVELWDIEVHFWPDWKRRGRKRGA